MRAERLRWRSEQQLERLLAALQCPLEQWQREWAMQPCVALVRSSEQIADPADGIWLRVSSKAGTAWLNLPDGSERNIGAGLLGVATADSLGLAEAVGRGAARALLASWCVASPADVAVGEHPGGAVGRARAGGAIFQLEGVGSVMRLVLDAALVDHWLQLRPGAGVALEARGTAVADTPVDVRISVPLGESRLDAAKGLRVGDVLVSSAPLDTQFELLVGTSAALAHGSLCQRQNHRALKIEAAPSKSTS